MMADRRGLAAELGSDSSGAFRIARRAHTISGVDPCKSVANEASLTTPRGSHYAVISHPNDAYTKSLFRALTARGYEVVQCRDRKELRREFFDCRPSLLITELRLPDGPVIELLGYLRRANREMRIVVITAHDSIATAVRCMRLGVNAYYSEHEPLERVLCDDDFSVTRPVEPEQPLRLDRALWEYVNRVVDQAGSITRAADLLGLDRRSLRRMLGRYAPPP
jgi:two-component system, response regulator RegA